MAVEIQLTKGYVAIIDDEDADLAALKWSALVRPHTAYAVRGSSSKGFYMHRVVLARALNRPLETTEQVDHINGIGSDNRRSNLRLATSRQNLANSRQHKNKKTMYKGVHLNIGNKNPFVAQIFLNGKLTHLGCFRTAEAAHIMYCLKAYAQWGEFANFGEKSFVPKKSNIQSLVWEQPIQLPLPLPEAA